MLWSCDTAHSQALHRVPAVRIRSIIISQIVQIAREHDKKLAPINDDLALNESGLDSLAIAVLVARLEDQLGANPFTRFADVALPVTIREFVRLYESDAREARPLSSRRAGRAKVFVGTPKPIR
jgi:hypothetical protein